MTSKFMMKLAIENAFDQIAKIKKYLRELEKKLNEFKEELKGGD